MSTYRQLARLITMAKKIESEAPGTYGAKIDIPEVKMSDLRAKARLEASDIPEVKPLSREVSKRCSELCLTLIDEGKNFVTLEESRKRRTYHKEVDETEFDKCTITVFDGDLWDMECKLGLWGVTSADKAEAQREALNYFNQYRSDGEYHSIIGGKSPVELLMKGS